MIWTRLAEPLCRGGPSCEPSCGRDRARCSGHHGSFIFSTKGRQMKRVGPLAIKIGLMICVSIGAVELGYANEREHATTCTLATLKGRYLFVVNGTYFPPASGATVESFFSRPGSRIFHGDGTGTTIVTGSINGVITNGDLHSDLSVIRSTQTVRERSKS